MITEMVPEVVEVKLLQQPFPDFIKKAIFSPL
jgi:hypothetical protein